MIGVNSSNSRSLASGRAGMPGINGTSGANGIMGTNGRNGLLSGPRSLLKTIFGTLFNYPSYNNCGFWFSFSAIYIRTGSLWYAMLLHFLVDFITQAGSSVGSASGAGLTMASIQSIIWTYIIISLNLFFVILPPMKKMPLLVKKMQSTYGKAK